MNINNTGTHQIKLIDLQRTSRINLPNKRQLLQPLLLQTNKS